MPRCRIDPELTRTVVDGFAFPLGVYPIEEMKPISGYSVEFEASDSGEEGQFEEWPDRYLFDIVISAERLEPLCRSLFGLLPGRIYPILDYLGHDQYREVDPYISYDLIGADRLLDAIRRYRGFFFEDGLCGFGAMIDDPFLYIFIDEHKIVTVRCEPERRDKVEKILQAFDLEQVPVIGAANAELVATIPALAMGPSGADAASHEHRSVLITADDRPDLLTADEIIEDLREEWNLVLNVDPETNVDEEGDELGITPWRCLVRITAEEPAPTTPPTSDSEPVGSDKAAVAGSESSETVQHSESPPPLERTRYADVILTASCLRSAEQMALDATDELSPEAEWEEAAVVFADRIRPEMFQEFLRTQRERSDRAGTTPEKSLREERIIWTGWLE